MIMRLIIDTLIAVMLVALLAGVLIHHRTQADREVRHGQVKASLALLHERTLYQSAISEAPLSDARFPLEISPSWFQVEGLPMNRLALGPHPWLDIAPPGDLNDHPPDPILDNTEQAGLWYNPNRGVFRARVPRQDTMEATLALYNTVNNAAVAVLANVDKTARHPQPHSLHEVRLAGRSPAAAPVDTPQATHATPAVPASPFRQQSPPNASAAEDDATAAPAPEPRRSWFEPAPR